MTTRRRLHVRRTMTLTSILALAAGSAAALGQAADDAAAQPAPPPVEAGRAQPASPGAPVVSRSREDAAEARRQAGERRPVPVGGPDDVITFDAFSEPVEISELVNFVASVLSINISVDPDLAGTVVFNESMTATRATLLPLLDAMLEQQGYTITLDPTANFYIIDKVAEAPVVFAGDLATTKVIKVPFIRPTTLQGAINLVAPNQNIAYIDELGMLIVRAPARQIARIEDIIQKVLAERDQYQRYLIELENVAARVARDRAIALAGGGDASTQGAQQAQQGRVNAAQIARGIQNAGGDDGASQLGAQSATSLDNLAQRLAISPTGNALIFNGTAEEFEEIVELVALIDTIDTLEPRRYFAGESAQQIADIARQKGLGEVVFIEDAGAANQSLQRQNFNVNQFGQAGGLNEGQAASIGGPLMVVYEANGQLLYYATPAQHRAFEALLKELNTDADRIVIRAYRLNNSTAEDVAAIVESLITGQTQTGDSPLLPAGGQGARAITNTVTPTAQAGGEGDDEISGGLDPNEVFIVADVPNNQVMVRAPVRAQADLERLIRQLDLRRAQVYIEALIVSVADTTNFDLAIETQLAGSEYAVQTNFGLTTPGGAGADGTGGAILDPRVVTPGLGGFTAAIIQSNYVPFVINALQTDSDTRILSTPQLLVNDNEEAAIVSVEEQPTSNTSQGDGATVTSFQDFQEAGTTLTVTPTISDAGFVRLEYEVELSNFTGVPANGLPSPRNTNNLNGLATIPSDSTIIIGGITVRNSVETIAKIPILGDIPLLGLLFRDQSSVDTDSILYVFITPRIMLDANFDDLKLFTRGPQAKANLDPLVPELKPQAIELLRPGLLTPDTDAIPAEVRPADFDPIAPVRGGA